jgi:hypothetical protein
MDQGPLPAIPVIFIKAVTYFGDYWTLLNGKAKGHIPH